MKIPAIHPLRLVAIVLIAMIVAYGSYMYWKPQTFAYAKLRDGVVLEGGAALKAEYVERASLATGGLLSGERSPIPGLIPYSQIAAYINMPVSRRLSGGVPLLSADLMGKESEGMSSVLGQGMTGMSIPVDNIVGVTPYLTIGDRVHLYTSFEDDAGAHTGLLLREMPVIALQREQEADLPRLVAVTIELTMDEAVLLTHALHYGKIHLGKAATTDQKGPGIGDAAFAKALMNTKKRWSDSGDEQR